MASGNAGSGEDDDEVSHHRHFYWSLRDIPKFEGKDEQPFLHLMEFEDYLVASGVRVEPEEIRGNVVQPDYQDIINKFKASLKSNARIWFRMYIEKRVPDLHSADGWKTVKEKFLTYFNPVGSTKEQQIKAWKEMVWKPEEEKLTDFVFRFSQLAYELGYSDEQQISHFVLCIPKGLYLYLKDAQTVPDAVENLRRGIALGGLDTFSSVPTIVDHRNKVTVPFPKRKENIIEFITKDTLKAVKETVQDSRYENLVRLLDKMGDRLANVVDVVEDFQRKQSSRNGNRERSNSRDRDHSRDNYKNRDRDRRDSRDYNRNRSRDDSRERDRHRDRSNLINERDRRKNQQRSGTSQRHFDNNEFCNYCDRAGHTTHRCYKLENYLKRKGKKITLHEEEDVQELAQMMQDLNTKLHSLKVRNSTNF